MSVAGEVAVVTGGTGTIGAEIAAHLQSAGATTVLWDRDPLGAGRVVECDVSDAGSVAAAMKATVEGYGEPRFLINAAGISGGLSQRAAEVHEDSDWARVLSSTSSWEAVLAVNVMGVVNTSREFARAFVGAGFAAQGAIVNITSISGDAIADPSLAAYSTSKAAVHMLTRLAAADFGPLGIQVNAVAPGFMETRMKPAPGSAATPAPASPTAKGDTEARVAGSTPLGRRNGRPSDIAQAVMAVLAAEFITGQVITVDGGLSQRSLTRP